MVWYAYMINRDKENNFEQKLNLTEYLAGFINPEGVQQIREERERKKHVNDWEFEQVVRDMFGRDITDEAIAKGTSFTPSMTHEQSASTDKKSSKALSIEDIKKYMSMSDEIKFYPNKK